VTLLARLNSLKFAGLRYIDFYDPWISSDRPLLYNYMDRVLRWSALIKTICKRKTLSRQFLAEICVIFINKNLLRCKCINTSDNFESSFYNFKNTSTNTSPLSYFKSDATHKIKFLKKRKEPIFFIWQKLLNNSKLKLT